MPAGCNVVRLELSPSGDRAYATARNSNALMVFDTSKLRSDSSHALVARVPVGTAPVGVTVIDSGRKVIVANSNRFAGSANDRQTLTVVDAALVAQGERAIIGSIAAGAFPRSLEVTRDGKMLIVANFNSKQIELVDLTKLPVEPAKL
jgi:DNA-binding beta-propeller fold protein YncE